MAERRSERALRTGRAVEKLSMAGVLEAESEPGRQAPIEQGDQVVGMRSDSGCDGYGSGGVLGMDGRRSAGRRLRIVGYPRGHIHTGLQQSRLERDEQHGAYGVALPGKLAKTPIPFTPRVPGPVTLVTLIVMRGSDSTDRAFGGLRSGNLVPYIGAQFTNNTGYPIHALQSLMWASSGAWGRRGEQIGSTSS